MFEIGDARGATSQLIRAASMMPTEAATPHLTQRRVIDFKRHAAARCRCC